jgi:hypothetical protein
MKRQGNPFANSVANLWTFDNWSHGDLELDGANNFPKLKGMVLDTSAVQLIRYDEIPKSETPRSQVVHFYINDDLFSNVMINPSTCMSSLSNFAAIIGPDVSPYATHSGLLRGGSIWYAQAITAHWQRHGLRVIPNLRWMVQEDLDYYLDTIPHDSVVAISTLGVSRTKAQRKCLRQGVLKIIREVNPRKILVHGIDRPDIFEEAKGLSAMQFFQPRIYQATQAKGEING